MHHNISLHRERMKMALREFKDSKGTLWTAWDVPPHRVFEKARSEVGRRTAVAEEFTPERRSGNDRRRPLTNAYLQSGWVCFAAGTRKRRLLPPPPGWHELTDEELETLCARAEDHSPRGR